MCSEEESDNKLFKNSISYLHKICGLGLYPPTLKCIYLTKARLMELRKNIHLPSNITRTTVRCQRCFLNLIDGPASYRIKPQEKKTKFARKVLAKHDENKPLTKFQRKYLKRLDRFDGNRLAITCKFCKKESLVKLQKPKKKKVEPKIVKKYGKKRKLKKKDRFAGLNQEAVLSVTPKNDKSFHTSDFISLQKSDKNIPRFQLSRKENVNTRKEVERKVTIKQTLKRVRKKTKLKEFLNSNSTKPNPASNLKHFLQSL